MFTREELRQLRRYRVALTLATHHGSDCKGVREHLRDAERLLFARWMVRHGRLSEWRCDNSCSSSSPAPSLEASSASASRCS